MAVRVLVVDDDPEIRALLRATLGFAGFEVDVAADAAAAAEALRGGGYGVLVLDVMLPGADGFELVRLLRSRHDRTPVLLLTARHDVDDKVHGLRLGADDYVTKPFSVTEVAARVEALARRSVAPAPDDDPTLRLADLVIDPDRASVVRGGRAITLSPTEYRLLTHLVANAGRVLSKSQLMEEVWGYDFGGDANVVERFVSNLRRKVDVDGPPLLHTVRGFGYTARVEG